MPAQRSARRTLLNQSRIDMPPKPRESDTFERVRTVADRLVLEFRPYGVDAVVCLRRAADEPHAEIQFRDGHGPARPRKGDVRRVGVSGAPRRVGVAAERAGARRGGVD